MARRDETADGITQRTRVKTDLFLSTDGSLVDASGNVIGLTGAQVTATQALVSEYEIPPDEFTDAVTLTATGVVHGMPGRLSAVTVLSGTCDLALADGAGAGTSGIRTIATYAGLTAGELIPFPGDGLPFVNALLATITGTATLRFEVI